MGQRSDPGGPYHPHPAAHLPDRAPCDCDALAGFLGFGFVPPQAPLMPPTAAGIAASLHDVVAAALRPWVAGRTIALLDGTDDPRSAWLARAVRAAGAGDVVHVDPPGPDRDLAARMPAMRSVIAASHEPLSDPNLPVLAEAARMAAGHADLGLCACGWDTLGPSARHRRFAEAIADHRAGDERHAPFARDLYARAIAVFDDAALRMIAGPALAPALVFHLADALGDTLEGCGPHDAARRAVRLDRHLAGHAAYGLAAVAQVSGLPVLAPFLVPAVQEWADAAPDPDVDPTWRAHDPAALLRADIAIDRSWVDAQLDAPAFRQSGLIAAGGIAGGLVGGSACTPEPADDPGRAVMRMWTLCCLAAWQATRAERP